MRVFLVALTIVSVASGKLSTIILYIFMIVEKKKKAEKNIVQANSVVPNPTERLKTLGNVTSTLNASTASLRRGCVRTASFSTPSATKESLATITSTWTAVIVWSYVS